MGKIEKDEYTRWRTDPVTEEVFKALRQERELTDKALTDANLILKQGSGKALARLVGYRDGLDTILQISYEDIEEKANE